LFYHFVYPLYERFFVFNVFRYITFRSVYATVTAILVCFIFGPPIIKMLKTIGTGGTKREWTPETHEKKVGTPSMGGLLIILAILFSIFLWGNFKNPYTIIAAVSTFCFGLIGFFDDYLKFVKRARRGFTHASSSTPRCSYRPRSRSISITGRTGRPRRRSSTCLS
jgi:phospho-N-acetylmuramoyl-pentapeptide-transferase